MAMNELDNLRTLAQFAEQVSSFADNGDDVRKRISHMITQAEEDIKTKSLEIQLQQSHIALLKHLDSFMTRPQETGANRLRLNEAGGAGPRAIAGGEAS